MIRTKNNIKAYKKNTLRNWYVDIIEHNGKMYTMAFGVFFNRPGIRDYTNGHTSPVIEITPDYEQKEFLIQTERTLYHCSFDSCFFEHQNESKYKLVDYEKIKKEYYKPIDINTLSKNDMLLVLSDLCDYFFEDLVYFNSEGNKGSFSASPHIGMFTDSLKIYKSDEKIAIDIRWYVQADGIEFYSLDIENRNLFIENAGDKPLTVKNDYLEIIIKPKERKRVFMRMEE